MGTEPRKTKGLADRKGIPEGWSQKENKEKLLTKQELYKSMSLRQAWDYGFK